MWSRRKHEVTDSQLQAEAAIASTLLGGDSLPAWNAIWDLVQSSDSHAKQELLTELRDYVTNASASDQLTVARTFESALEQSLTTKPRDQQVLPSREVRAQYKRDQIEANREAMRDIGVRPGEGLPMWAIYMTRRSKRTWG